jgi:anti-sigma factor RsiW
VRSIACKQLVELVTDYLDDALSDSDRQAVENHLLACDDCTEYLAQMRVLVAGTAGLLDAGVDVDALPPGMLDGLLQSLRLRGGTAK